jgi:indoleamine 2,3-dioxygenase
MRHPSFRVRGFLPMKDPLTKFPSGSPYAILDEIGDLLPAALGTLAKPNKDFRYWARHLDIPLYSMPSYLDEEALRELQLYYVRTAFLASAYVHQVGEDPIKILPKNIARAISNSAYYLTRPPILSYDGYALYNWRRIDPNGPVALGNIDTIQNFVDLRSEGGVNQESWFILVHVEIEAIASEILRALMRYVSNSTGADEALQSMYETVVKMTAVLRRIPEHMDPALYRDTFRPYIKEFKGVTYEGVNKEKRNHRGETGAQSSIMPLLEALLKIPHKSNELTRHLADMRSYMPFEHVLLLEAVDKLPPIVDQVSPARWNALLDAIAEFRKVHLSWAKLYIEPYGDKKGTGGTLYAEWLKKLKDETLSAHK